MDTSPTSNDNVTSTAGNAADDAARILTGGPDANPQDPNAAAANTQNPQTTEPAVPKQELFSEQFQRLAREKRTLEKTREQLKLQEKEYKSLKEREAKFREDPTELLTHYGWDFEALQEAIVSGKKPEFVKLKELENKIAAQEEQRKADEKARVDAETKRNWDNYTAGITNQIKEAGEKYELINFEEVHGEVAQLMIKYYDAYGKTLTWQQAADMVEEELTTQLNARGEKYKKLKKLSKLFENQQVPLVDPTGSGQTIETINTPKPLNKGFPNSTLTKDMAGGSPSAPKKFASRDEEILEAAKLLGA